MIGNLNINEKPLVVKGADYSGTYYDNYIQSPQRFMNINNYNNYSGNNSINTGNIVNNTTSNNSISTSNVYNNNDNEKIYRGKGVGLNSAGSTGGNSNNYSFNNSSYMKNKTILGTIGLSVFLLNSFSSRADYKKITELRDFYKKHNLDFFGDIQPEYAHTC
jgi:hypothetical protein